MQAEELTRMLNQIQACQCEMQTIEVKSARGGCPMRLFDTLSSFSNQDGGGTLVFGLDEKNRFAPVGVYDAQDLQKQVTEQCKQMVPAVRPLFTVCALDGKLFVSAEIPGADIAERPVYYAGAGKTKGSFIRVGDSDEHMSEYEIYSYEAYRKSIRDDQRIVANARAGLMNRQTLETYMENIKRDRPNLAANTTDDELSELMGITVNGQWTLASVLVFSKYPQAYFPQLCVTAVVAPGTRMGETGEAGERFLDNKRITGTIPEMLSEAVDFVRRNARVKTIINDEGKRVDQPEFPVKAVREAILNALVHRDYSIHTENIPVRIEMYADRMEIKNSGGLYGRISIDSLGKVRPETRNAALANILETLRITENRYSGIPTIRYEFQKNRLPEPEFKVIRGDFTVIFRNGFGESAHRPRKEIARQLLNFCQTPRTREELTGFTGFSKYYTMSRIVSPLVEEGALLLSRPDTPRSKNQTYRRA